MIRPVCPATRIPGPIGRPLTRCCSISTARCSTRRMTTTSGATSCRSVSRWRRASTCTRRTAEIARRFAERSGTLDWYCIDYWSRTLGIDIGALHREVRSHVAWLPGAREFLVRMRAAGKRLVLLTNSHPIALAVKHEETGVLDYLDAAVTSHDFGAPKETRTVLDAPRLRDSPSIRRAACSPTTTRRCSRRRASRAFAGCTACATGTPGARGASMSTTPRSTRSETWRTSLARPGRP